MLSEAISTMISDMRGYGSAKGLYCSAYLVKSLRFLLVSPMLIRLSDSCQSLGFQMFVSVSDSCQGTLKIVSGLGGTNIRASYTALVRFYTKSISKHEMRGGL